jgi:membrane protein
MGAALAFYMALSLAPTVVIILAVTGIAFGAKAAQGRLVWQIQGLVGYEGAKVIQGMIEGTHRTSSGIVATLLGLGTLFFGATAVVTELRDALNTIWKVPEDTVCSRARSIFKLMKERIISFALVLAAGIFLLTSLIVNTWVSAAGKYLSSVAPPPRALIQVADWVVSFGLITALFAFIFKVLPDVRLKWGDVGAGAVLTSLLFTAGKVLLGIYLGKAGFADSYGAAGSLVVLLVWVYYSAQVVFLGAEFTRAYALRFGSMFAGELAPSPLFAESCVRP